MILSDATLNVLKNFSDINPSILIRKGNIISTISPNRTMFAQAVVAEEFETPFAIYELSKFLGALSLFDSPELKFAESHVDIVAGNQSIRYTYADPSVIVAPPADRTITLPSVDVDFELSASDYSRLMKAMSVLQAKEVVVSGDGANILMKATNTKNSTADVYSLNVGTTTKKFTMIFKQENLRLMNRDYKIELCLDRGLARFTSDALTYYIPSDVKK